MRQRLRNVLIILVSISILVSSNVVMAKSNNIINFKDKNLQNALSKYYDWNGDFTKEKASELSKEKDNVFLGYAEISNLEGLQYFDKLIAINVGGNNLSNLKLLTSFKNLQLINISDNSIKGKKLESILNQTGIIKNLKWVRLYNNKLVNINFLNKIGNINNYTDMEMDDNKISNISILKDATSLTSLDLSNNRITDVTPLKGLKKLTFYIDLRDNCILNYKPIKPLLDKMFSDPGNETGLERYDYYTNPVNFKYNGKTIKFPYLTTYYKYQAYAEAIPLFKDFGGSAKYNKKTGTLTCKYDGKVLTFRDFSAKYTLNGKEKSLKYPMRRMQYDLAYVPVKDICEVLGMNYKITKIRKLYNDEKVFARPPKNVEISKAEQELG